jgi:hypothetical protein
MLERKMSSVFQQGGNTEKKRTDERGHERAWQYGNLEEMEAIRKISERLEITAYDHEWGGNLE